jgi:hypothetical protein
MSLLIGLFILSYFLFSGFTLYLLVVGDKKPQMSTVGKVLYWHGVACLTVMIATAVCTLSMIFATFVANAINVRILIGG